MNEDNSGSRSAAALKSVLNICSRAKALVGKRHRIVHGGWGVSNETREVRRYAPGSSESEPVALSELKIIIEDYRRLIDDALDLADQLRDQPPQMVSLRHEEPPG
jgi:hypothetical protein